MNTKAHYQTAGSFTNGFCHHLVFLNGLVLGNATFVPSTELFGEEGHVRPQAVTGIAHTTLDAGTLNWMLDTLQASGSPKQQSGLHVRMAKSPHRTQ